MGDFSNSTNPGSASIVVLLWFDEGRAGHYGFKINENIFADP